MLSRPPSIDPASLSRGDRFHFFSITTADAEKKLKQLRHGGSVYVPPFNDIGAVPPVRLLHLNKLHELDPVKIQCGSKYCWVTDSGKGVEGPTIRRRMNDDAIIWNMCVFAPLTLRLSFVKLLRNYQSQLFMKMRVYE